MKLLLFCLLLSAAVAAQEVKPVISDDYLQLIKLKQDSSKNDGGAVMQSSLRMRSNQIINRRPIEKVRVKGANVYLKSQMVRALFISGSYSNKVELRSAGRLPATQDEYVQGRSENGIPAWRGPETGELLSYGPRINELEYDGSSYPYDVSGRLVAKGSGSGTNAHAYANSIFHTGVLTGNSLDLQARCHAFFRDFLGTLRVGRSHEDLFIKNNTNKTQDVFASLNIPVGLFTFLLRYNADGARFSHSNRYGLLNRIYETALLTPVSFDNIQGSRLGAGQRSYSPLADNPLFLQEAPLAPFVQSSRAGAFTVEFKQSGFKATVAQTFESARQDDGEGYEAGTAFFQNGILFDRSKHDRDYSLNAAATFVSDPDRRVQHSFFTNFILRDERSSIGYTQGAHYEYSRSGQDASLRYSATYKKYNKFDVQLSLGNKLHASNTAASDIFFLPEASIFFDMHSLYAHSFQLMRAGLTWNRYAEEIPVRTSFSQQSLTQYATQDALSYLPATEVNSFRNLSVIRHREASLWMETRWHNNFYFRAEFFDRATRDDVFPIFENGSMNLKNLAGYRDRGLQLELRYDHQKRYFSTNNSVSFLVSRNRVTRVRDGYEGTALAGFSNVYKTLVTGEQLGAIAGSSFLRNAANAVVIGNDGFPLVNNTPALIGRPNPDFVLKTSHVLGWKKLSLNLDLEWDKGGQIWNGTQAALDYYGRSQSSANLRTTQDFVFAGVRPDGHVNDRPVRFYDPLLPVEANRWVRYGQSGVAEEYIRKADCIRVHTIGLAYEMRIKKYIQSVKFNLYIQNLIIWSASPATDPSRLLFDQGGTEGLNYFNLPAVKTIGLHTSIQF